MTKTMARITEKTMARITEKTPKSHTLPSSPSHSFSSSSSSSSFEFTISLSPPKSSAAAATLCPADDLFYKGQLLPLHLSPRLSMVRTLLLASSSSSSSDTTTTASRDSTASSSSSSSSFANDLLLLADFCDSSRPSSAAEDDDFKRLNAAPHHPQIKKHKYFSLSRFSSVFRKEPKPPAQNLPDTPSGSSLKRISVVTAKEVIRKYLKKVKPLYEKLSQKQQQQQKMATTSMTTMRSSSNASLSIETDGSMKHNERKDDINGGGFSAHSFSGNLKYPRRKSHVLSCPSSMRSSPSHSGVLYKNGFSGSSSSSSTMEELQSAIQGAIAHCKNSMIQNKGMVRDDI